MPTPRLTELPDTVLRIIEKVSGPVVDVQTVTAGLNSAIAARVRTSERTMFVKGLPLDHPWVWTQKREAQIAPYLWGIAPTLLWHIEEDGWSLLGFKYVEGGHADYTPKSSDLPAVMATMIKLGDLPEVTRVELKSMPHRLRTYVDDVADLSWFAGNSLLHTDWNPHNVLMTGNDALLVDWGWASTGAAWIDPALWLLWLIAHGHTPGQAESAAATHPAWGKAPPAGLDVFALAQHRLWDSIAAQSEDPWAKPMQHATHAWHKHRQSQP